MEPIGTLLLSILVEYVESTLCFLLCLVGSGFITAIMYHMLDSLFDLTPISYAQITLGFFLVAILYLFSIIMFLWFKLDTLERQMSQLQLQLKKNEEKKKKQEEKKERDVLGPSL
ncbi:hypothetical protein BU26DRAFT_511308 [Trematosphaeria pertusa]|uniref:Uncharacterized protein n=1 Tax=Trematosphaeria pertusa TaxID=390896 RepID=A0A6A6HU13_9PLEO|nr:uncharacterized protein BU26DRAFT_511308 [Trematosphaeria pertusa]KAF2241517.1 hypothetical protein BU26DRAFT_511308 [Trematosphaeria pertusa]